MKKRGKNGRASRLQKYLWEAGIRWDNDSPFDKVEDLAVAFGLEIPPGLGDSRDKADFLLKLIKQKNEETEFRQMRAAMRKKALVVSTIYWNQKKPRKDSKNPYHARSNCQSGGKKLHKMKPVDTGTYGAAGPVKVYTPEEIAAYERTRRNATN